MLYESCTRILSETVTDADQELLPLLTEFAADFLAMGGVVTLSDLAQLSRVEFTALAAAAREDDGPYNTALCRLAVESMK